MARQRPVKGAGSRRSDRRVEDSPRLLSVQVLQQLLQAGRSFSDTLPVAQEHLQDAKQQALLQEFCFGVARWRGRLEAIAGQLLQKPLKKKDADIHLLILLGLYQQIYMRLPDHAAVSETAEAARQLGKPWAVGLVNGVLRSFQRQQTKLLEQADREAASRTAFPDWLLDEIQGGWPDDWQDLLEAENQRPPMTLRVNRQRISRSDYLQALKTAGIEAKPVAAVESAVVLEQPCAVTRLPGFSAGDVSVQDAGAQLAAGLLDLQPGQQVLDACAAPGGKSCHILESVADISLTALDVDDTRLQRVADNLNRLNLNATLVQGDAAAPEGQWAEQRYDRILLDVPCSATGVIRRHPDIKWLRRPDDIARLAALQARILDAIWPLLAPGGLLLYATCSLLPQENEEQVRGFLSRTDDAVERPIEASWGVTRALGRQTLPGRQTMDGFYYACLEKR